MTHEQAPGAPGTMGRMGVRQQEAATPGLALRRHRLLLLFTSWPWRSLAYLLTTPLIALTWCSPAGRCSLSQGYHSGRWSDGGCA